MNMYFVSIISIVTTIILLTLRRTSLISLRNEKLGFNEAIMQVFTIIIISSSVVISIDAFITFTAFLCCILISAKNSIELKKVISCSSVMMILLSVKYNIHSPIADLIFLFIFSLVFNLYFRYKNIKLSFIKDIYIVSTAIVGIVDIQKSLLISLVYILFEFVVFRYLKKVISLNYNTLNLVYSRFAQLSLIALIILELM